MLIKTTRQTYSAPCRRDVNIAVAIVLALLVPTAAHAQQRTFYDAHRQECRPRDHRQQRRDHVLRRER